MRSAQIGEGQRKSELTAAEIDSYNNSFVIFPYQVSGFIDYTNRGYSNTPINPEDYETFKRLWTGNDACVINWKGSCFVSDNAGKDQPEIKWQLGEFFYGQLEGNSKQVNINKDKSYSTYTSQESVETITFRVDKRHIITDYYNFMFYKIPEISKSTLFRIDNIERDYVGRELIGYVITFKTINQELSNTGRARQQNIMPCAPGQGYLEAIIYDKEEWEALAGEGWEERYKIGVDYFPTGDGKRIITADFRKAVNDPVKRVVVKLFGAGIINSFVLNGRPCFLGDNFNNFKPSRPLFPINITSATTPNLVATQNDQTNFYFGEFWPTLEYFKDLMSNIKDSITPVNKWDYQGWLTYDYNQLKSTNPIEGGTFKNDLYGWLDTSNGTVIQKPWEFLNKNKTIIDTAGIVGLKNQYVLSNDKPKRIEDHFFDNFWTTKMMKVLPIEKKNSLSFGQTISTGLSVAAMGGIAGWACGASLLGIGILGTMKEKLKPKTMPPFRGIIPASLIDFNNQQFAGNKIPFNIINSSQEESPNSVFFSGSTIVSSFEADLTDYFYDNTINREMNTINIGQFKNEDGDFIIDNSGKIPYLLSGDCNLLGAYNKVAGYIIDGFKLCACFNGEISVEFKNSKDQVIWSGVYQSEGKWTNSLREIWTEKNTSIFGRENIFLTDPPPNIEDPVEPDTTFPTALDKTVNIDNTVWIHQGSYGRGRLFSTKLANGAKWGYWVVGGNDGGKWWSHRTYGDWNNNPELTEAEVRNPYYFFQQLKLDPDYDINRRPEPMKVSLGTYKLSFLQQSYKRIDLKYYDWANNWNGTQGGWRWWGCNFGNRYPKTSVILSELWNHYDSTTETFHLNLMTNGNNEPVDFFEIGSSTVDRGVYTNQVISVGAKIFHTRLSTQCFWSNMDLYYDVNTEELYFTYVQWNPPKGLRGNYSAVDRKNVGGPWGTSGNDAMGTYGEFPLYSFTANTMSFWQEVFLTVGNGLQSIKLIAKTTQD